MTALTTTQITGRISLPNDVSPSNARVKFSLSRRDFDLPLDITVLPTAVYAEIDDGGDIEIGIWPNDRGLEGTYYVVAVLVTTERGEKTYPLGGISLTTSGSAQDLNDLLDDFKSVNVIDYGSVSDPATKTVDYGIL